ncbi:MAG: hypothetical protein LHV68_09280 [Elusimicrobia bacterium]|nr:hypothetical protein [Candidatus Liberimonas magnetica]
MDKILVIVNKDIISVPELLLKEFLGGKSDEYEPSGTGKNPGKKLTIAGYLGQMPVIFSEDSKGLPVSLSSSARKLHLSGTHFAFISTSGIHPSGEWLFAYNGRLKNEEKNMYDHLMNYIDAHKFKNPLLYLKKAFETDVIAKSPASLFLANSRYLFVFKGKNSRLKFAHLDENWIFCSQNIKGIKWRPVKNGHLMVVDKKANLIKNLSELPLEHMNNYSRVVVKPISSR